MDEPPGYSLGHSARELDRLSVQARLVDPITRRFFVDAGIVGGMRVLDVGSGVGDVAFLAAELVGDAGEVVGTERSGAALAAARARANARSLRNVTFREGGPADMTFEHPFDAVVGRYVLMFQPDPTAMLRSVAAHAHPGGVVVFQESYRGGIRSYPAAPTYDLGRELVTTRSAAQARRSADGPQTARDISRRRAAGPFHEDGIARRGRCDQFRSRSVRGLRPNWSITRRACRGVNDGRVASWFWSSALADPHRSH